MASALDRLVALAPPSTSGQSHDWASVERSLGAELPDDYKHMVDAYGPGCFDAFIWVLFPSRTNPNLDLLNQRTVQLEALTTLHREGEHVPYDIANGAIIPWAITENGDVCYWIVNGLRPDDWSVVVNESRGPQWETFEGSTTEFLVAVLSGALTVGLFPDDFPSAEPSFDPLQD